MKAFFIALGIIVLSLCKKASNPTSNLEQKNFFSLDG